MDQLVEQRWARNIRFYVFFSQAEQHVFSDADRVIAGRVTTGNGSRVISAWGDAPPHSPIGIGEKSVLFSMSGGS